MNISYGVDIIGWSQLIHGSVAGYSWVNTKGTRFEQGRGIFCNRVTCLSLGASPSRLMERPSGRVIYSGRNGSNERDFIDTVQMDQQDLAPTKAWDLDVPLDFGRADSGSDLPSFDGLLTSLQATRERGTPPLVATSPALLEDYCNKASLLLHLHLGRATELDLPPL